MFALVDIGNTWTKLAIATDKEVISILSYSIPDDPAFLKQISDPTIQQGIVVASGNLPAGIRQLPHFITLNAQTPLPFSVEYKTPQSLGADRIALAAAAHKEYPNQHVLVIDAGTCLTTDLLTSKGAYLGGTIAPGLTIRLQSLHTYTSRLPLLEKLPGKEIPLIGSSTKESIESGVVHGMISEIDGLIDQYRRDYENLTVVLTGGDAKYLANHLKSEIFADFDFMWKGLLHILDYNRKRTPCK